MSAELISVVVAIAALIITILTLLYRLAYRLGYESKRIDDHGYRILDLENAERDRVQRERAGAQDLGRFQSSLDAVSKGVQEIKEGCLAIRKGVCK